MTTEKTRENAHLEGDATGPLPSRKSPVIGRRGGGRPGRSGPPGNGNARKHGLVALKRAVSTLGRRTIDGRTLVGKALAAWRSDLIADLGGLDAVSTQELALIEEAVKTKLILDSLDSWLLSQSTLINRRSRAALPAVRDRNALVTTLRGLLGDLGLRRRTQEAPDLAAYLTQRSPAGNGADRDAADDQLDCGSAAGERSSPSSPFPPEAEQR